ncbi:YbaB/EbfC family nucleoid-associated protein [bacterium]|nr:YbaB/EbfC family nucleoid-associated protein [bacterium]
MSGGMGDLVRQAQKMQGKMSEIQSSLKERIVEGASGGGMVKVLVNGQQEVMAVKLNPEVVDPDDVAMLEDLILAAARQGLEKAKELANSEMAKVTGGMNMPGLF